MSVIQTHGIAIQADHPVLTHEPLRVSLDDLLQSDTRGKWWLVGAGWQGNPLLEVKPVEKNEDSLLEMAREQGMNTDVRRSIFVILMTSEVSIISNPSGYSEALMVTGLRPCLRPHVGPQVYRDATTRICAGHITLLQPREDV